eukprot:TRINITY_DN452_c0_g1_i1.p1 TRINITY_DN452_c0_g1~~TRINITY_DN452_c0_g1_i1.p1  ORF type:complete len:395 (+),score=74.86 TRINITY_DN452_c0_g1_i1:52-1236(+)
MGALINPFIFLLIAQSYAILSGNENLSGGVGGTYTMKWNVCGKYPDNEIEVTLTTDINGWMGLNFNGMLNGGHTDKDMIFAWMTNDGTPVVIDAFAQNCDAYGLCNYPDVLLNGTNDIYCVSGSNENNITSITFRRKVRTGDPYDDEVEPKATAIQWAFAEVIFPDVSAFNNLSYLHFADCVKYPECLHAIDIGIRHHIMYANSTAKMVSGQRTITLWNQVGSTCTPCQTNPVPEPQPAPQPESPQPESPQPESPQPESPQPESPQPESPQPESPQPESPQPQSPQPESPSTPSTPVHSPTESPTTSTPTSPGTPVQPTPTTHSNPPIDPPSQPTPTEPLPTGNSGFDFNQIYGGVPMWGWIATGSGVLVALVLFTVIILKVVRKKKVQEWDYD